MSAVFKRTGSNEGIEMPVKEVITRMMLSVMFGLDEKEDLHIFNVKGQKVAFLFSRESSFTPQTPGDYIIKLDSELSILGSFMQKFTANTDAVDPQALSVALLNKCPPDSWVIPSSQPGCSSDTRAEEARQYAQLKRPGCEEGIELELGVPITKGMICELCGLGEIEKLTILVSSVVFPNTLSEECSLWCKDDLFCPNSSDVYIVMTGAEMEDREHGNDVLGPHKTLILKKPSMFEKIPSNLLCGILNRLSLKTFGRLAITCHEMLPILQLDIKVKESPHILTIITNETNSNEYGLLLARKQPTYMGTAEIHTYYLGDLKAFVLEGVRAKGDPTTSPKACLLRACQEIRRQKLAFKTFYSIKNRLTTVVEMLEILKPRRAEIWLVSFSNRYKRELDYGEGFTGRQWPFGNVGEELKLITSTFDYIREMNYDRRGMFYMISGLKIFQAFCVLPPFYSVTDDVLRNFRTRPETGNIQLIQFLYPDRRNSNIFDGISRIFEETYRMASQRLEVGPRIRAGILSENGERIAIVETRKYSKYRLVSMSFTAFDGYETQLGRIYREFDNIHFTIDQMFME